MTLTANFSPSEIALGLIVGIFAQVGGLLLLRTGGGTVLRADISDERARPMSVAITPIVDDAPLLKLGTKRQPGKLPDRWIAPRPVERAAPAAHPSPQAQATPRAIPSAPVADAGQKPPPPDAELAKRPDLAIEVPSSTAPTPVSPIEGALDGVKEGTETDPLKANAISMYKSQLDRWFSAKFNIRGKVPFETLKALRATVQVTIGGDRTVTGFTMTKPSGNDTFDDELRRTMESIVQSNSELPSPPPNYPDILKSTQSFSFHCSNRSSCE